MTTLTGTVTGYVINPDRQTQLPHSIQSSARRTSSARARTRTDNGYATASNTNEFPVHEVKLISLRDVTLGVRTINQLRLRYRSHGARSTVARFRATPDDRHVGMNG